MLNLSTEFINNFFFSFPKNASNKSGKYFNKGIKTSEQIQFIENLQLHTNIHHCNEMSKRGNKEGETTIQP